MDIIFDIDGTLADATHRLHFIKNEDFFVPKFPPDPGCIELKPDWDTFLSDEQVALDKPIPQTWAILANMLDSPTDFRVIFITGRKESSRQMTYEWLTDGSCEHRAYAVAMWRRLSEYQGRTVGPILYMRSEDDRRPSHVTKRDLLHKARADGFDPKLAFEDRKSDAAMWRSEGLLCCQVAEGDY